MKENKLVFIVFGIILLLFIVYFLQGEWLANQTLSQPKKEVLVTLKTYTDPANYFNIKIPSNLQTTENVSTNTTGLNTSHPVSQKIEIVTHMIDGAGVTIQVYESQPNCMDAITPNTTIANLPASYNANQRSYTIQAADATYVLYSFYPGSSNMHIPFQKPRLTQQQKNAYEKSLQSILQTFHPISYKSLSC